MPARMNAVAPDHRYELSSATTATAGTQATVSAKRGRRGRERNRRGDRRRRAARRSTAAGTPRSRPMGGTDCPSSWSSPPNGEVRLLSPDDVSGHVSKRARCTTCQPPNTTTAGPRRPRRCSRRRAYRAPAPRRPPQLPGRGRRDSGRDDHRGVAGQDRERERDRRPPPTAGGGATAARRAGTRRRPTRSCRATASRRTPGTAPATDPTSRVARCRAASAPDSPPTAVAATTLMPISAHGTTSRSPPLAGPTDRAVEPARIAQRRQIEPDAGHRAVASTGVKRRSGRRTGRRIPCRPAGRSANRARHGHRSTAERRARA